MMRTIFIILILGIGLKLFAQTSSETYDFSGMDKFWEIIDFLEKDQEAPEVLWNELFNTPGYQTIILNEFSERFFKNSFEMVFMPSKKNEFEENINKKDFKANYIKHIARVKENKVQLKKFQNDLMQSAEIYQEAIAKCKAFLPQGTNKQFKYPKVSFIIFGPDCRGYGPIVLDALYFITADINQINLLAHELHHVYLNHFSIFRRGEEELNWIFNQVYKEGIADLIDKEDLYFSMDKQNNTAIAKKYLDYYENTPQIIQQVDSLLTDSNKNPEKFYTNAKLIQKAIPMAGHTIGYYMANAIISHGNTQDLLLKFGNPYAFIQRYNSIATIKNLPSFSSESMVIIQQLDKRYQ